MQKSINGKYLKRFEDKFEPEAISGCWIWMAYRDSSGYGRIRSIATGKKVTYAHRVSYELYRGPFDKNLCVLHKCDTPACCNPTHLFLGTRIDNMLDKKIKGRGKKPKGSANQFSKINDKDVDSMKQLYKTGRFTQQQLGVKFKVSRSLISHILTGRTRSLL